MALLQKLLNKSFFESVLNQYYKQNVAINNVHITNDVSPAGESFCSTLSRIKVDYSFDDGGGQRTLWMVCKSCPEDEYQAGFVREMKMFDCELEMYGNIIPLLSRLDYREKMSPIAYWFCSAPLPMMLLEDLSAVNYKLTERRRGLDLEHCLSVVEKLAYFHSASVALHEKDPNVLPKFSKSMFRKSSITAKIISINYDEIVKQLQNRPDVKKHIQKMKLAKDRILTELCNVHKINCDFKVLNHGDCWINNIMFRYNNRGVVSDVAFVDYTISCFSSPCLDLHYFLTASANLETRSKYSTIIDHYFENLTRLLRKFHTKSMPTREQFDADFRIFSSYGFGTALLVLPFSKANHAEGASMEAFLEDESATGYRYHVINNEAYIEEILHFLPFYHSLGIFDQPAK
uniref:CHK kinase-like domain-containing protein n=2 Tax=Photinus pyralis TaxID=7054 RepID=A0A1Y1M531_PHOPY